MIFGFIVAKYVNSNAIVLSKNLTTTGIGVGQTNRLASAKQAISQMKKNFKNTKAILASDGFFPFPDIVKLCAKNKVILLSATPFNNKPQDIFNMINHQQ